MAGYCHQRNFMNKYYQEALKNIKILTHKASFAKDGSAWQDKLIGEIKAEKEHLENSRAALQQHDDTCTECNKGE